MKTSFQDKPQKLNIPLHRLFIDFVLFRIDPSCLKESMEAVFKEGQQSDAYSMDIDLTDVTKLKNTLLFNDDKTDSASSDKNIENYIKRLKLFFLLSMTLPVESSVKLDNYCDFFFTGDNCPITPTGSSNDKSECLEGCPFLSKRDLSLSSFYKTLLALSCHYPVLSSGDWIPVVTEVDVFGYLRTIVDKKDAPGIASKANCALILVNRNPESKASVSLDISGWVTDCMVDALDNYREIPLKKGILQLTLNPLEGRVFLKDRWATEKALQRKSGILLHPTSLPSNYGIGDMGIGAREFVDFLEGSGQKLWQVLPLNPPGYGNSPYQCLSAFAGNSLLIDIDQLKEKGLLRRQNECIPFFPERKVSFEEVSAYKDGLLREAYAQFQNKTENLDYLKFCLEHQGWLDDYCLFRALKSYHDEAPWNQWEQAAAIRKISALDYYRKILEEDIDYHKFLQFEFFRQWTELKGYANRNGIDIIGDLPIYVSHDSSDVWKHPELFHLDSNGNPVKVAGVPPDEFSRTGQLWGNPIYRWDRMEETGYAWWKDRILHLSKMVDLIRIDHFRGFEAYWEVPAEEDTAVNGRWVKGPGEKFFAAITDAAGDIKIIAEDLGFITPEVEKLKEKFGFPGMSIMQFELRDGDFVVPLYKSNTVAYTGTHDNDTIMGWYRDNFDEETVEKCSTEETCWSLIKKAMLTDAETVIIPLQDVLCLGSQDRMNTPGTSIGNWEWRYSNGQLNENIEKKLLSVTKASHR